MPFLIIPQLSTSAIPAHLSDIHNPANYYLNRAHPLTLKCPYGFNLDPQIRCSSYQRYMMFCSHQLLFLCPSKSLAGYLAGRGFVSRPCRHVELGFCIRLFSSSLNCDRPSHPDWGRLGVVRAVGVDNRWQGLVVLWEAPHTALCQRNLPAKLGSMNKQYKPQGWRGRALGHV